MIAKRLKDLEDEEIDFLLDRETPIIEIMPEVSEILADVQENGETALNKYTETFDNVCLEAIQVAPEEIEKAQESIEPELMKHLEAAAQNILAYHMKQRPKEDMKMGEIKPGIQLGQKTVPLNLVGVYVPGGNASYPSTALMTIIPAKVAGVSNVIMCTPPGKDGSVNPLTLAAAKLAGADEIYKVGGAQAIAAMAFGTSIIPRVEKIVGPGNEYVTAAKMLVRDSVEIDFPAGPSEIVIVSDKSGDPDMIAMDMLAQMEHGPHSSAILITNSDETAAQVKEKLEAEVSSERLERCAVLTVKNLGDAVGFVNLYAPEHLEIIVAKPKKLLDGVQNAGSIFIGPYSPVAAGDYASGTNHVLPTSGYARAFSGLSVAHFTKTISVQKIEEKGLESIKDTIVELANAEGLPYHAKSVQVRFGE